MKPFFKPEDFYTPGELDTMRSPMQCATIANAKLEREGKIVFSQSPDRRYWEDPNDPTTQDASERSDLQALLINIEPIEKCTHPAEKVIEVRNFAEGGIPGKYIETIYSFNFYKCECGATVKPDSFKEIP